MARICTFMRFDIKHNEMCPWHQESSLKYRKLRLNVRTDHQSVPDLCFSDVLLFYAGEIVGCLTELWCL